MIDSDDAGAEFVADDSDNPFVAFRRMLAWDAFAASAGLNDDERRSFIERTDALVASVAGTGFRFTPVARESRLSDELGFSPAGGVWVKDETHNVAGSHKARHLFTELLHLLLAESRGLAPWNAATRPELAIASCGNAAIAASTLAAAVHWPIRVFVPQSAGGVVVDTLNTLGATIERCPRRVDDPPGDPCVLRFRERVAAGAVPFGVQGTENAWCLDGGRVIGWEIVHQLGADALTKMFVQVGGGAFAAGIGEAFVLSGLHSALITVQTHGCAPLERAWRMAATTGGTANAGPRWAECMWPWESEPASLADGILDDETYDWVAVCDAMTKTGGFPVVSPEADVVAAYAMAHRATSIDVSPTGSAGLAGLITLRAAERVAASERVGVVFSGIRRGVDLPALR
ncbi:MAG: pyridoxal-phosphate dependent enzyme [Acidobacteria bacterium]|nr:pyridoxal-phosphate dependent enzyme [Acidobacteriota bacterium]